MRVLSFRNCLDYVLAAAIIAAASLTAGARPVQAQIAVAPLNGATVTPQTLANSLLGGGIVINNVAYVGANNASGQFSGAADIFDVASGVVLTTGNATSIVGPNTADDIGESNGQPGDPALAVLAQGGDPTPVSTFDASSLLIEFTPIGNAIQFTYVFGSDEYNEFVGEGYNDVFAFYVNGVNFALVPGSGVPVSVDTINLFSSPGLYVNNDPSEFDVPPFNTQLDGFTRALAFQAPVNAGRVNTLRLAIADVNDDAYDSAVMIQAGSLISVATVVAPEPGTLVLLALCGLLPAGGALVRSRNRHG